MTTPRLLPSNVPLTYEFGIHIPAGVAAAAPIFQLRNLSTKDNAGTVFDPPWNVVGLTLLEIVLLDATATTLGLQQVSGAANSDGTYDANFVTGNQVNRGSGNVPHPPFAAAWGWAAAPILPAAPIKVAKWDAIAIKGNRVIWEWPDENPFLINNGTLNSWCVANLGAAVTGELAVSGRFLLFPTST